MHAAITHAASASLDWSKLISDGNRRCGPNIGRSVRSTKSHTIKFKLTVLQVIGTTPCRFTDTTRARPARVSPLLPRPLPGTTSLLPLLLLRHYLTTGTHTTLLPSRPVRDPGRVAGPLERPLLTGGQLPRARRQPIRGTLVRPGRAGRTPHAAPETGHREAGRRALLPARLQVQPAARLHQRPALLRPAHAVSAQVSVESGGNMTLIDMVDRG